MPCSAASGSGLMHRPAALAEHENPRHRVWSVHSRQAEKRLFHHSRQVCPLSTDTARNCSYLPAFLLVHNVPTLVPPLVSFLLIFVLALPCLLLLFCPNKLLVLFPGAWLNTAAPSPPSLKVIIILVSCYPPHSDLFPKFFSSKEPIPS